MNHLSVWVTAWTICCSALGLRGGAPAVPFTPVPGSDGWHLFHCSSCCDIMPVGLAGGMNLCCPFVVGQLCWCPQLWLPEWQTVGYSRQQMFCSGL